VFGLKETGELRNAEIVVYLNRLSDLLWLFECWVETKGGFGTKMKHAQPGQLRV
jgi:cob(I)alamin adenosyltransferase